MRGFIVPETETDGLEALGDEDGDEEPFEDEEQG